MPKHLCIDPHDPYALHEVIVEFERSGSRFRLVTVIDDIDDDILADLVEAQRDDLRRELANPDLLRPRTNRHDGSPNGLR